MKYIVIKRFADLTDNKYLYAVGAIFPRSGLKVSAQRLQELSSVRNREGTPLIEKVNDDEHDDGALSKSQELVRQRPKKVARKSNNS